MRYALPAIAAAAMATTGFAATSMQPSGELPGQVDVSRVTAGTYATDPAHTLVQWQVDHFGFNPYYGSLGNVEGTLTIDPGNIEAAALDVTIPISSMSVVSEGLREHLFRAGEGDAGPDFFGPEPGDARFVSRSVTQTGDTSAIISGTLTMNGTSNPVAIAVDFTGAGTNPFSNAETIGFTGRALIKRSDYGISGFVPLVGDEVALTISAAFEKQ